MNEGFDISKSGLPKKILIGPFVHDIVFAQLDVASDKPVFGVYCFEDLQVSFKPGQMSPAFAVDSVLHELLHGIWRVNSLHLEEMSVKSSEEKLVSVIATQLTQLLRANPKFRKWLLKHAV
jgi:hypothetical protein